MSGETEVNVSGWTVDTLHGMLIRINEENVRNSTNQFNAIENATNLRIQTLDRDLDRIRSDIKTQTDALAASVITRIEAMDKATMVLSDNVNRVPTILDREILRLRELCDEKFNAVNSLIARSIEQLEMYYRDRGNEFDLRYQQRFDAQQQALSAALVAGEKAVNAALISAERAVAKAESAAEKRFESVDEFRQTLTDQAQTFLTRVEGEARFESATEKVQSNSGQISKIELELRTTLADTVRRNDLQPINNAIDKLREGASTSGGRSQAIAIFGSGSLAVLAILVSIIGIFLQYRVTPIPIPAPVTVSSLPPVESRLDALLHQLQQNGLVQQQQLEKQQLEKQHQ
jgi:hypothetical protein